MTRNIRILIFGIVSGAIWSLPPLYFNDSPKSSGEVATVIVAAIMAGICVSFSLKKPLEKTGHWGDWVFGALSLPVGAFLFGVFVSIVQQLASMLFDVTYEYVRYGFRPLVMGFWCMVFGSIAFVGIFFPLAIMNTIFLRGIIFYKSGRTPYLK